LTKQRDTASHKVDVKGWMDNAQIAKTCCLCCRFFDGGGKIHCCITHCLPTCL